MRSLLFRFAIIIVQIVIELAIEIERQVESNFGLKS